MRKLIVIAVSACALAVLAATAMAATKSVKVGDDYYVRPSGVPKVTVTKGTTVRWRFVGDSPHSVTVSKGPGSSTPACGTRGATARRCASAAPTRSTARCTAPRTRR